MAKWRKDFINLLKHEWTTKQWNFNEWLWSSAGCLIIVYGVSHWAAGLSRPSPSSHTAETCCLFMPMHFHLSFLFLQSHVVQTLSELCRPLTVTARVSVCDSWCETLASVTAYAGNVLWFSGRGRAKKEQDNKSFSPRLTPERGRGEGVIRGRS